MIVTLEQKLGEGTKSIFEAKKNLRQSELRVDFSLLGTINLQT